MSLKSLFKGKNIKDLKKHKIIADILKKPLPKHVAIIMDGNGRWATRKGLPRMAGHRQGVEAIREIIETTDELGIPFLTLYAFSTENWRRPKEEVDFLMSLLVEYLQNEIHELHRKNVRINILGCINSLPDKVKSEVRNAMELTSANKGICVNVAINYGGRAEIIHAVYSIVKAVQSGDLCADDINEYSFSQYLYTKNIPDPDLLIRTGGENRISNFLLYQIAYTELFFTSSNVLWPDFKSSAYLNAIMEYQKRQRRYGGIVSGEDE